MSAASYNRGSKVVSRQLAASDRPVEFLMMEELNALEKDERAQRPFGPIHFVAGHGGFWATCPVTGYGFWYRTLRAAVRAWRVTITTYANEAWISEVSA